MIAILFNPSTTDDPDHVRWWADFKAKAETATDAAIIDWEEWFSCWQKDSNTQEFEHSFKQTIWADLKRWLYEHVFHGKCAYCESTLELDRYLGDAEHFRPKGQVTTKEDGKTRQRAIVTMEDGRELEHPGYFWLAYDWRNLMPACSACNSGAAKVDQFPAAASCLLMVRLSADEVKGLLSEPIASKRFPGFHYLSPADLDLRERPLLLNPLNPPPSRDPKEHLRFGLAGTVVALGSSELGKHSIEVFRLDRDALCRRRQRAQETIHRIFYAALQEPGADYGNMMKERMRSYRSGLEEYSAAALDYLKVMQEIQRRAFEAAIL